MKSALWQIDKRLKVKLRALKTVSPEPLNDVDGIFPSAVKKKKKNRFKKLNKTPIETFPTKV